MFKSFQKEPFFVIATFVSSDNDVKLLTHNKTNISSIKDLKGHKIGTIKGTSAHFFLDHTLLMNGVNPDDVEIVSIKPEETAQQLMSGSVDVVVSWEPYIYLAKKIMAGHAKVIHHDKMYLETFNLLTNKEKVNDQYTLKKMLRAIKKSVEYINDEPEETRQILSGWLNKDISVIESTWNDFNFDLNLDQSLIITLETEARWALERKLVNEKHIPNYLDFIRPEALRSISQDAVNIIN